MNQPLPPPPMHTKAILSLVFGLLAWMACPVIAAIPAVILGHQARADIRRARGTLDGDVFAVAGLVFGWANIALTFLIIIGYALALLFLGGLLSAVAR